MSNINMNFSNDNPPITSSRFWVKTLIMAVSIFLTCQLFSLAEVKNIGYALLAAIIISLLNAFLKPVLVLFSLPLMISTLGLFNLVINALIIYITSWLLSPKFYVEKFFDAILFSIVITFLSFILDVLIKLYQAKKQIEKTFKDNNANPQNQFGERIDDTDYEDVTDIDEGNDKEEK